MEKTIVTRHIHGVPIEAAHHIVHLSDLVYLFGPRHRHMERPQILRAVLQFGLPVTPPHTLDSSEYEAHLFNVLLDHLAGLESHVQYVLQRLGSVDAGWVWLVPVSNLGKLQGVLDEFHLREIP